MTERRRWAVRETLQGFAGPHAFAPWIGIIVLAPLSVGTAFVDVSSSSAHPLVWARTAVFAFLVALAAFFLFGLALRWVPRGTVRVILVAMAYGCVEAIRAVFVEWFITFGDANPLANLPFRIVAGFTTGVALFALASTFIGDAYSYRTEIRNLRDQEEKLRQMLTRTVTDLATVRREIMRDVRETVDTAIAEVLRRSGTNATAQEVVDTLVEVSDGVIRPLSHDLHERPRLFPEPEVSSESPRLRVSLANVISEVSTVAPFRPWTTVIFGALLMGPVAAFTLPLIPGLITAAFLFAPVISFLGIGALIARRYFAKTPVAWRVTLMFVTYGVMGAVIGQVIFVSGVGSYDSGWLLTGYAAVISVFVGWMLAVPPGLRAARARVLSDTGRINDSLRWELARANARVWQEQQELSSVLHRDIQGSLLAAAFRLTSVIESGGDTVAAIDEVRTIVTDSVETLAAPTGPTTLHEVCDGLAKRWEGVLEVRTSYSAATRKTVEKDAVLLRALRDITAEFATNAIKHGRARTMTVDIRANTSAATVDVVLSNDGRPLAPEWTPGLGTMLITNLTTHVETTSGPDGVTVRAELPTGPASHVVSERLFVEVPR